MAGPFARKRGGDVEVTLTSAEQALVHSVVSQMTQLMEAPEQVMHTERLFPPAYLDDADAQAEYARLMTADLLDGKRRAVSSMHDTIERGVEKRDRWRVTLTADEAQDWLAVLNDARLTLGTRLDVQEKTYDRPIDPADEDAAVHEVFRYLGYLEEYLVDVLMG
jgi:hypothetical protein